MALKLRTFDRAIVHPLGVAHVDVNYGAQRAGLPLYITREKGSALLGRQWLRAIRLDWGRIFALNTITSSEPLTTKALGFTTFLTSSRVCLKLNWVSFLKKGSIITEGGQGAAISDCKKRAVCLTD